MRPIIEVRTAPGPTSTNVRAPRAYMASTTSTKRTRLAIDDARSSRTAAGAAGYASAVALAQTGIVGDRNVTSSRALANGPTEPATIDEWNAAATGRRWTLTPAAEKRFSASSMAGIEPEITTCLGSLWLATTAPGP